MHYFSIINKLWHDGLEDMKIFSSSKIILLSAGNISLIKIKPLNCSRNTRHINKREQVRGLILIKLREHVNKSSYLPQFHGINVQYVQRWECNKFNVMKGKFITICLFRSPWYLNPIEKQLYRVYKNLQQETNVPHHSPEKHF